jgi:hypothetical protein
MWQQFWTIRSRPRYFLCFVLAILTLGTYYAYYENGQLQTARELGRRLAIDDTVHQRQILLYSKLVRAEPNLSKADRADIARCSRAIKALGQEAISLGDPKAIHPIPQPQTAGACQIMSKRQYGAYDFTAPIDATMFDTMLSGNDPDRVQP